MLSKISVKKPFTVVVSVILVIILGVISFKSMNTDLLPKIDLPYVIVSTTYAGASPEKIELSVTKPLEQVLATSSGIKDMKSVSSENSSMIILEFNQDINMDSVMIELGGKIDMVKAMLEDGVGTPMLIKINPNMIPVMVSSVDIDGMSIEEVSKYVKDEVIPKFERIDGVASVTSTGMIEENLTFKIDQAKINSLNDKVLSSVDSKLADAQRKIDDGRAKIEDGKKQLDSKMKEEVEKVVSGGIALNDGKEQLTLALNDLPKTKNELEEKKAQLVTSKQVLENLIDIQTKNNIPLSSEEQNILNKLNDGINQIEDGIKQIDDKSPELASKLEELTKTQGELESAKMIMSQELNKAYTTLLTSEAELNKANTEFEKSRDEAYKKAGLTGVITVENINNILKAENFSMPAGYIKEGDEKYLVKVGDKFKSEEELNDLTLFHVDVEGIGDVKLNQIGGLEKTNNKDKIYAKINGNDGILLTFQKQSTSSTTDVSKKINETVEELTKNNPDMHITNLEDQGVYINVVVNSVLNNLALGGILAIIILYIFLRNIKPTVIIAFSIPISLLFALVLMYFSGVTLNIISLSGLALGVGMLVDNSIVVIENIFRMRDKEGFSPREAAVKGAKQVSGAIAASTLTTISVFLPIVFTHGMSRQLFTDMGLTIAYSLIASLIVALTLVPTMSSAMKKSIVKKKHSVLDKIINFYEKTLRRALNHRLIVMAAVLGLLVLSAYLSISMGTVLMPSMDGNQITITMTMDKDAHTEDIRNMSNTIMEKVLEIDDVKTIGALEGSNSFMNMGDSNNKSISMYALLKEDKSLKSKEVGKLIEEKTKDLNCKLNINTSNMDMSAMGGTGVGVIIKGDDLDQLKDIAKDVSSILENEEGIAEVNNGIEDTSLETRIIVDKNKAMQKGLTVAQVYQDINSLVKDDTSSTKITINSKEYPVILVNDESKSLTRVNLKNHKVKSTNPISKEEVEVNLSDIADITEASSLSSVKRENQVRAINVSGKLDSTHNVGIVSDKFEEDLRQYNVPDGYTIELSGEKESIEETFTDLVKMIALAIVFIYLIMVAEFQSLLSPFIVLFTIPLAFTGGFLALVITGFELSMISLLGFLILSGVVVNNGIVFVDYANQLRLTGLSKREALVLTGKTRMRPILMTALTTILGLSTLAMGIGMGADMVQPMAIVTIGGLTYATILTLIVVPVMYDILHKKELSKLEIETYNAEL